MLTASLFRWISLIAVPVLADMLDSSNSTHVQVLKRDCINSDCSAVRLFLSNPPVNLWCAAAVTQTKDYLSY